MSSMIWTSHAWKISLLIGLKAWLATTNMGVGQPQNLDHMISRWDGSHANLDLSTWPSLDGKGYWIWRPWNKENDQFLSTYYIKNKSPSLPIPSKVYKISKLGLKLASNIQKGPWYACWLGHYGKSNWLKSIKF